jgi:hypothetical protein
VQQRCFEVANADKKVVPVTTTTRWIVASVVGLGLMLFVGSKRLPQLRAQAGGGIGGNFGFCFPAPQMNARAQSFRSAFVNGYLTPRAPYPVFAAMYQAGISPISHTDELTLGRRGPFSFTNGSTLLNDATSTGICNSSAVCDTAAFLVTLGGSTSTINVDFASRIQVTVSAQPALKFDFGGGIPIHIPNTSGSGLPILRKDMFYRSISISGTTMEQIISSPDSPPLQITVDLALVGDCPNGTAKN